MEAASCALLAAIDSNIASIEVEAEDEAGAVLEIGFTIDATTGDVVVAVAPLDLTGGAFLLRLTPATGAAAGAEIGAVLGDETVAVALFGALAASFFGSSPLSVSDGSSRSCHAGRSRIDTSNGTVSFALLYSAVTNFGSYSPPSRDAQTD